MKLNMYLLGDFLDYYEEDRILEIRETILDEIKDLIEI